MIIKLINIVKIVKSNKTILKNVKDY
jgi:hypothetical protein